MKEWGWAGFPLPGGDKPPRARTVIALPLFPAFCPIVQHWVTDCPRVRHLSVQLPRPLGGVLGLERLLPPTGSLFWKSKASEQALRKTL